MRPKALSVPFTIELTNLLGILKIFANVIALPVHFYIFPALDFSLHNLSKKKSPSYPLSLDILLCLSQNSNFVFSPWGAFRNGSAAVAEEEEKEMGIFDYLLHTTNNKKRNCFFNFDIKKKQKKEEKVVFEIKQDFCSGGQT